MPVNNYTCIIVDDEQDAIELIIDRLGKLYNNLSIVATYSFWQPALAGIREHNPDLLLLDISMPGKTTIELLRLLPNLQAEIVFITAHDNYALEAFSFSASGYILKPVDDAELFTAVNKAIDRIQNKKMARQNTSNTSALISEKIGIPNNQGIDYISVSDILYLESTNKCTRIVTRGAEYTSSANLGKFKHLIDDHSFFQVHRSFIINLNSISRYETSGLVIMSDKKEIPVSRSIKNDFLKIFNSNF
jgi:two-component system LytT family response regulator